MAYKSLQLITISDIEEQGIQSQIAVEIHEKLSQIIQNNGACSSLTWQSIAKQILNPELPFSFHQIMYYGCYQDYGPDPPAWLPDLESAKLTNIGQLLERDGKVFLGHKYRDPMSSFSDFQEFSVLHPEVYWQTILGEMGISVSRPPQRILHENSSYPGGQWLPGCSLNPAKNCLNLNSKRHLDSIAVIWRNEGEDDVPVKKMTFHELRREVWVVAHALDALGLPCGSAIAIDMPMNVESVIVYLAIVLTGNVVVSIADSFAPSEISTRLKIAKAKAIFTQDNIIRSGRTIPLYRRVIDAQAPLAIVIPTSGSSFSIKLRSGDISWHDFRERVKNHSPSSDGNVPSLIINFSSADITVGSFKKFEPLCVAIPVFPDSGVSNYQCASWPEEYKAADKTVEAFSNILFSSGTTGEPKAIPWSYATPIKAAADAWCHMDIRSGDIVAWPTNLGWMMGPWLVYASLLNNATIALYNGSPLGSGFAKFVQDANVTMLGVVPSIVRAWKSTNSTSGYNWSTIRCFGSTGEASSVDEYLWLMGRASYKPVIEYCGGTEIGGGFITGSLLQAQVLAAFSTPAMGCSLFILDNHGNPIPSNASGFGELALGPLMFGASHKLLNGDHYKVYFEGMPTWKGQVLRRHGDVFERTSKGYYRAHGRADDTMNLGGIKVSSVEIERLCNGANSNILETAAVGVPPTDGGPEQLVIAVVFKDASAPKPDLNQLKMSFNFALQKQLNPLFKVSSVVPMTSLPRTATNKVMRRVLRQQFTQPTSVSKL